MLGLPGFAIWSCESNSAVLRAEMSKMIGAFASDLPIRLA
ncbi:hypothetical protein CEV33_1198 [Brucella grignonensis]|uniref:Uncharacterized protein n=1 Tax=Brucella grignonensis TaxID=94627 RepID=A0A256FC45_9HYPH|nr:hypothetical protein CEV33_1198 [Brucella grignonensis]